MAFCQRAFTAQRLAMLSSKFEFLVLFCVVVYAFRIRMGITQPTTPFPGQYLHCLRNTAKYLFVLLLFATDCFNLFMRGDQATAWLEGNSNRQSQKAETHMV